MYRKLLFALLFFIKATAFAQENQISVNSKISDVTVFMNGAQVQRLSDNVDLPQGVSLLVFSGLSSSIETQSLQAKGEGNFTILSVAKQNNFLLDKKKSEQKAELLAKSEDISDKIVVLNNEMAVYKAEEEMLMKNQTVMGPNVNYDLTKLKAALDFQKLRLNEAKNKQATLQKEVAKLYEEINKLNRQAAEVDGKPIGNSNDVVVKVSAKSATRGKFTLTYLVKNASWYPSYDIRAKDVASPIQLVYKANVSQNSGEEWKNVKLILSSGNPSNNNEKPILPTYNLGYLSAGYSFFNPIAATSNIVKGKVVGASDNLALPGASVRVKNSSIATVTDADGNYSIQLPAGSNVLEFNFIGFEPQELVASSGRQLNVRLNESMNALNEVVVTGYGVAKKEVTSSSSTIRIRGASSLSSVPLEVKNIEKQTNVTFEIRTPYTILSDGKQATVDIGNYDFKADYEYYAVPKVTSDAFLTAKITDFNEVNFISGEASIFFEGTYLGKSLLDISNTDTLTISLGVDKNVSVKREKQKGYTERQFIGSSQKDTRHFVIDIKNRKSQAVNLIIEDQLPIPSNNDITVEKQELSKAKLDETNGKLTWQFVLQPNEQKKIDLKYQVKYPKNRPINIE
ncbi:MAG: mucoidy inhibitor MuiA family protein [Pedobacter sp.]|uniref:mucoidy inhibitor MuiA family protein n=1 Tax=Pedobacter sp. TaxID=1411316 RepID=UPI0028069AF4|nr:mucoidy inhibitor MuiA family protein [Pedobacter sp.]MDQ8005943.1 mucoidy inhibitor MuiA family protein [Pedobacter sp.]